MTKKAINLKETSFTQAINISAQWCKEWKEELLSEEVLADRVAELIKTCLLYTSPSPRDRTRSRMPSSA